MVKKVFLSYNTYLQGSDVTLNSDRATVQPVGSDEHETAGHYDYWKDPA